MTDVAGYDVIEYAEASKAKIGEGEFVDGHREF
jgi:hypothetical protein